MSLTDYRTLGRSGLVVSPHALGTMTFGTERWGSDVAGSRAVFDAYVEAGGNFIDTADVYASGRSEAMLGDFIAERGLRDRLVLATKAGFNRESGNPYAGGNGAKNIHAGLIGSLRRLKTDYVDLFWMHVWDAVTPADEVLQTLGDLVRAGKIRYFGLSNVPAWYAAQMATLARTHGVPAPIALQLQYSLAERSIEHEHVPAAREFGLGIVPWSPLAAGLLTGKYAQDDPTATADARLSGPNPFGDRLFSAKNWQVVDVLKDVAAAVGRAPAEVALAWAMARPGVTALVLGVSKPAQLQANLESLDLRLTADQQRRLDEAGAPPPIYPYPIFAPATNRMLFGGNAVRGWH